MFVSGSQDRTIRFWDLRTSGCVNLITAPPASGSGPGIKSYLFLSQTDINDIFIFTLKEVLSQLFVSILLENYWFQDMKTRIACFMT